MAPPPRSSMWGISYFKHRNTPVRLTSMVRFHTPSVISAAGVMGCSTPAKRPLSSVAISSPRHSCPGVGGRRPSGAEQRLDGAALVHGAIALGGLVEREGEVEDLPRVDLTIPDEVDELGQEPPDRCGAAV